MSEQIVFIGLMAWDHIGKGFSSIKKGEDIDGIIIEKAGGVILNIILNLSKNLYKKKYNLYMVSATGNDKKSKKLIKILKKNRINTKYIEISKGRPDSYLAIEENKKLLGAVADTRKFKKYQSKLLNCFYDSSLGDSNNPYEGNIILDGNVSKEVIDKISKDKEFDNAKIFLIPASSKKCALFKKALKKRNCSIFLNLNEAKILCNCKKISQIEAGKKLISYGNKMIVITNEDKKIFCFNKQNIYSILPKKIENGIITGLGDMFVAGFLSSYFINEVNDYDKHLFSGLSSTEKYLKIL